MSQYLGVSLIVENMPGAGSLMGIKYLMNAKPDGYIIGSGISSSNLTFYPKLVKGSGVAKNSITPVFRYDQVPNFVVVRGDSPWKSFADFMADVKKRPNQLKHGTYGAISMANIVFSLVNVHSGTQTRHVPFNSSGESLTALLGGHVDIVSATGLGGGLLQAGKIRVLAVATRERVGILSDVPTLKELGYPVEVEGDHGMFVPNGTPIEVQDKLMKAAKRAFDEHGKEISKILADMYLPAVWGDREDYKKVIEESDTMYNYIIDLLKIPSTPMK
jgi:tripartite-type tricarboxylate transporter receptor subunit TctC